MLLSLNPVSNRQIQQKKSLSFGITQKRLKEIMDTYKVYPSITLDENNQWSAKLKMDGDYELFCNNSPIQVTYRNEYQLLPKIANRIPDGSNLQKVQFLTKA